MPAQYIGFFTTSAGAAASLVGLLFVALSIDADFEKEARLKQFALSETAFISLGGIFIVSLLSLLPSGLTLLCASSIVLAVAGIAGLSRIQHYAKHTRVPVDYWYIFVTIATYLLLAASSVWIWRTNGTTDALNVFCFFLAVLFGLSLIRAWRALLITKRHSSRAATQAEQ